MVVIWIIFCKKFLQGSNRSSAITGNFTEKFRNFISEDLIYTSYLALIKSNKQSSYKHQKTYSKTYSKIHESWKERGFFYKNM